MKIFPLVSLAASVALSAELPESFEDAHMQGHCLDFAAMLFPDELIAEIEEEARIEAIREQERKHRMSVTELLQEAIQERTDNQDHDSACCGVSIGKEGECLRCGKTARAELGLLVFGMWHSCVYDPINGQIVTVETQDP